MSSNLVSSDSCNPVPNDLVSAETKSNHEQSDLNVIDSSGAIRQYPLLIDSNKANSSKNVLTTEDSDQLLIDSNKSDSSKNVLTTEESDQLLIYSNKSDSSKNTLTTEESEQLLVDSNKSDGSKNVLTTEESDQLLQDIDIILAEDSSTSSDEFYPDQLQGSETESETGDVAGRLGVPNQYFLTNVSIDSSVAPEFVNISGNNQTAGSADFDQMQMFDPFMEFENQTVEKSSSQDSFVNID